jgi:CshA-type fibril repeat protein
VSDPATVTVDYDQSPPVAVDDLSSGNPAGTVTLNVVANDTDPDNDIDPSSVDLDPSTPGQQTVLVVLDEGTWSVDGSGNVSFTPLPTFTDDPTPIPYTVSDTTGLVSNEATITVDYVPVARDDASGGNTVGTPVVVPVVSNDTDGDAVDPTTVQIVGTANPGDSLVVPGEGTWSVNSVTGDITFTPEIAFTGDPTPIQYTVDDAQGNTSNQAIVTVTYVQSPPVAEDDGSFGNIPGTAVTLSVTLNDSDVDGNLDVATVDLDPDTPGRQTTLLVPGEGTWSVDNSGNVTFTPVGGFTDDPTPIPYTVQDTTNLTSNRAYITIDYVPVASNDVSSGNPTGTPVTVPVLANDTTGDTVNPLTVQIVGTSNPGDPLSVPGQGTWSVDPATGDITFTPQPGFTGDPTPIQYTVADHEGNRSAPATVTVDYNQQPPVAVNDSSLNNPPGVVTLNILANDSDPNGDLNPASVDLNPGLAGQQTTLTVPGEGTWAVDPLGNVTFTPLPGFTLDPTPIPYTVSDLTGLVSNQATITIDYRPVAVGDISTGNTTGTPVTLNVLANDTGGDTPVPGTVQIVGTGSPLASLVVPGEGTWSINPATGAITFTPASGFTGDPTPIQYTVQDAEGNPSNPATVTVDYVQFPPVAVDDSSLGNFSGPVTLNVVGNDSDPNGDLNPATVDLNPSLAGQQTTLVVSGEGTWTVDVAGNVTFTPQPGFTRNPTPIAYTVSDNTGLVSNPATITITYLPVTIGDTVFFDANGNGVQDPGEPGIPGVTVTLEGDSNGDGIPDVLTTVTDANGNYQFASVTAGTYTVIVTQPAGTVQTYDLDGVLNNQTTVTVLAGTSNLLADFGYRGTGSIGDRLWIDTNGDGVQDAGEPNLPGVDVTLTIDLNDDGDPDYTATATSGPDGSYQFNNLIPGTYTITVDTGDLPLGMTQTGDPDGTLDNTTSVTLAAGETNNDIDFGYQGNSAIGNLVWLDMDGDAVADPGEPGIAGVTVNLTWYGPDGVLGTADDQVLTTTSDANGYYAFTGIPGGVYQVDVDQTTAPAGTSLTTANDPTTLVLAAGQTNNNVDFGFNNGGLIGQWVFLDINGNGQFDPGEGISGVTVTAVADIDGDGNLDVFTTVTDADGRYQFPGLPIDDGLGGGITYVVTVDTATLPAGVLQTVDPDGTFDDATTVTLSPSSPEANDLDFGYRGLGSIGDTIFLDINGNNVADPGEGIGGVTVTLTGDFDGDGIPETVSTVTDSDGNYLFSGLVTDDGSGAGIDYVVAVIPATLPAVAPWYDPDGTLDHQTSVTLTDANPVNLNTDFGYAGPGSIAGTVFLDGNGNLVPNTGEEIAGVTVTLTGDFDGDGIPETVSTVTDANGNYLFDNLPVNDGAGGGILYTIQIDTTTLPPGSVPSVDPDGLLDNQTSILLTQANPDPAPVNFGYRGNGSIGDTVFFDANGNGVQDPGEPGLPGVPVQLLVDFDQDGVVDYVLNTVTNANGNYLFDHLTSGDYTVVVTQPAGTVQTFDPDGVLDNTTRRDAGRGREQPGHRFRLPGHGLDRRFAVAGPERGRRDRRGRTGSAGRGRDAVDRSGRRRHAGLRGHGDQRSGRQLPVRQPGAGDVHGDGRRDRSAAGGGADGRSRRRDGQHDQRDADAGPDERQYRLRLPGHQRDRQPGVAGHGRRRRD